MNSKLHAVCDEAGKPILLHLTAGQVSDYKGAQALLPRLPKAATLIADRGYDGNWFRSALLDRRTGNRRITLGADKAYDVTEFVSELRARKVTPHIAINGTISKTGKRRKTAIDGRTTRHPGYEISLRCRKRIEEIFGWAKASAGLTKFKVIPTDGSVSV